MAKKKKVTDNTDETMETNETNETLTEEAANEEAENNEASEKEIDPKVKKLEEKYEEVQDKYLRLAAEYDNFRKRSAKEKENVYADAYASAVLGILPIVDNIDRAASFATDDSEMAKGILMLQKQCYDALSKMGVKPMESDGAEFNPELHNAVMHEEDDSENQNIVSETFQKGYMFGDKVVRHAMVKVLN